MAKWNYELRITKDERRKRITNYERRIKFFNYELRMKNNASGLKVMNRVTAVRANPYTFWLFLKIVMVISCWREML